MIASASFSCKVKGINSYLGSSGREEIIDETVSVMIQEKPLNIDIEGTSKTKVFIKEKKGVNSNSSNDTVYELAERSVGEKPSLNPNAKKEQCSTYIKVHLNRKTGLITVKFEFCDLAVVKDYSGECVKATVNKF